MANPTGCGIIRYGSKSTCVELLQTMLRNFGYKLEVDGDFGSITEQTVKDYQRRRGLAVDGVVGDKTWTQIVQDTARRWRLPVRREEKPGPKEEPMWKRFLPYVLVGTGALFALVVLAGE